MNPRRPALLFVLAIVLAIAPSCGESAQDLDTGQDHDSVSTTVEPLTNRTEETGTTGTTTADGDATSGAAIAPGGEDDRAALIAAAAVRRVTVDNSHEDSVTFDRIVIVDQLDPEWTDDGEPVGKLEPMPLTPTVRSAVDEALDPIEVTWMSDDEASSLLDRMYETSTDEAVVVLHLSEPIITGDTAQMNTSLDCGPTCGTAGSNEFHREADGSWTFVQSIGPTLVF